MPGLLTESPRGRGFVASVVGTSLGGLVVGNVGSALGWVAGGLYRRWVPPPECDVREVGMSLACIPAGIAWYLAPVLIGAVLGALAGACLGCWLALRIRGYNRRLATAIILLPALIGSLWTLIMLLVAWPSGEPPGFLKLIAVAIIGGIIPPVVARSLALWPFKPNRGAP